MVVAVAGPRRVLGDQDDDDQREQRQSDHPQHHLVREGAAHHLADQRASTVEIALLLRQRTLGRE
eukprot:CAMPEP_0118810752 /NCGR_PEP_ID=MMETSP1162-20130426/1197_1 /TAXON_ID=33656 /ORGANISM="Phaeocystis Sp, Strain CCMP2710" /LENGTH=64 /DNA_ID=CAMNT_0006740323 /DNA_START=88 /DNA_END=282 /DNA_ORIENTATION=+